MAIIPKASHSPPPDDDALLEFRYGELCAIVVHGHVKPEVAG
jgi:hypothetical protein